MDLRTFLDRLAVEALTPPAPEVRAALGPAAALRDKADRLRADMDPARRDPRP